MMDEKNINKQYWSTARTHDVLAGVHFPGEEFIEQVPVGVDVLDVGCGNGTVSKYLQQNGCLVTGVDINQAIIDENKKTIPGIEFFCTDITERLPFTDDSFAAVVISYVLVSLIDDAQLAAAVSEIKRVLKPGGIVWVCEATHSPDYQDRYAAGKEMFGRENIAVSFEKDSIGKETEVVKRIIRHFSSQELVGLFSPLQEIFSEEIGKTSPSSGLTVQTLVKIFK